jgi:peptide/nickel transport system substrate-binding protein
MISMATLGSELSLEVQFIREFRDNLIKPTFIGSKFAQVFNAWYYSFSPEVSVFIAEDQIAKEFMKVSLYPLMGIMRLSYFMYQLFGFNPELGVFTAILTASSLLGIIYFSLPIMMLIKLTRRSKGDTNRPNLLRIIVFPLLVSLTMTGLSEFTNVPLLMAVSMAMLVLSTISASALTVSIELAHRILHI